MGFFDQPRALCSFGVRSWPTFQLCGVTGLLAGSTLACLIAEKTGFEAGIVLLLAILSLLVFLLLAYSAKWSSGRESLSYYPVESAAMLLAVPLLFSLDRPPLPYLDLLAIGLAGTYALIRLGCHHAGCCHGKVARRGLLRSGTRCRRIFRRLCGFAAFPGAGDRKPDRRYAFGRLLVPFPARHAAVGQRFVCLAGSVCRCPLLPRAPAGRRGNSFLAFYREGAMECARTWALRRRFRRLARFSGAALVGCRRRAAAGRWRGPGITAKLRSRHFQSPRDPSDRPSVVPRRGCFRVDVAPEALVLAQGSSARTAFFLWQSGEGENYPRHPFRPRRPDYTRCRGGDGHDRPRFAARTGGTAAARFGFRYRSSAFRKNGTLRPSYDQLTLS